MVQRFKSEDATTRTYRLLVFLCLCSGVMFYCVNAALKELRNQEEQLARTQRVSEDITTGQN